MTSRYNSYILTSVGTFVIILFIVAIFLHCVGIFLLRHAVNRMQCNQRLYLINFSAGEILMCLAQLAYVCGHIAQDRTFQIYSALMQCTLAISWCMCMIFLTVDRFFEIKLNIKYDLYVTHRRVTIAIISVWVLAVVNATWMILVQALTEIEVIGIVLSAIFPVFEGLFLTTCISVYVYIFRKVKQKTAEAKRITAANTRQLTDYEKRVRERKKKETRARNFVPFYIIVTFLGFSTTPELIAVVFLEILKWDHKRSYVMLAATGLFATGYIIDALIYILMYRQLKQLLFRKFLKRRIVNGEDSLVDETRRKRISMRTAPISEMKSAY